MALTPEEQQELEELERLERAGLLGTQPAGRRQSSLTPAEQRELEELERLERAGKLGPKTARFSLFRAVGDGLTSAIDETMQLADEGALALRPAATRVLGDRAGKFITRTNAEAAELAIQRDPSKARFYTRDARTGNLRAKLSRDEVAEQGRTVGTAESIVSGLAQFGAAFVGPAKFFKVGKSATVIGNAGRSIAAGSVVNFVAMDEVENNLANILRDSFNLDHAALDALATEADDSVIVGRLKAVVANLPVDIAAEGLMEGGIAVAKAYRNARSIKSEVKDLVEHSGTVIQANREAVAAIKAADAARIETVETDVVEQVNPGSPPSPDAVVRRSAVDNFLADAGNANAAPAPNFPEQPAVRPRAPAKAQRPLRTMNDFVGFLHDYTKSTQLTPEQAAKLLKQMDEDPENILPAIGVNPDRLSGPTFTKETIKDLPKFQQGLAKLRDDLAKAAGQTGEKSWLRTQAEAVSLGWNPEVFRALSQASDNLAAKFTASRMILGQQAHKMLGAGGDYLSAPATGRADAFASFLAEYHTFAAASAVLRGASSEIGRALQAHQSALNAQTVRKGFSDKLATVRARAEIARSNPATASPEVPAGAGSGQPKPKRGTKDPVDIAHPEVEALLTGFAEGRVDDELIASIRGRHGLTERELFKQLGVDRKDVEGLLEAEAAYADLFSDATTEAGRIRLVQKLLDTKGDIAALTRQAKLRQESGLIQRIDGVVRDTTGNLFTLATAGLNVIGSVAMMGEKTLGTLLSGVARGALGDRDFAYRQVLTSWSMTHGFFSSFSDAMTQARNALKRDVFEELALNADALKLHNFAADMQAKSASVDNVIRADGVYRRDLNANPSFYIPPEDLARLDTLSKQLTPAVMLSRGMAALFNLAGSASRLGNTVFIKAPDQFAAVLATRAGAHAAAVRIATDEAVEAGLSGKQWRDYVKARAVQVADGVSGAGDGVNDPFTAGAVSAARLDGQEYAEQVLFQDDLEWAASRALSNAFGSIPILGTLVMPFRHTPFRIIERTIIDYMPLTGLASKRIREALLNGTAAERDEVMTRWALSATAMTLAAQLVDSFDVRGYDEGSRSTGRLEAPSYTVRIGDDIVDFGRIDPFGSVIGIMADVKQYREQGILEDGEARGLMDAVAFALMRNVMSKSWLQSLSGLVDLMGVGPSAPFDERLKRFAASYGARLVPGAGLQRYVAEASDPYMREARGFLEGVRRASLGSKSLPIARDHILGAPIRRPQMGVVGVRGQLGSNDKLREELSDLAVHIQAPPRTVGGVKMDSAQWSRFLELRGQIIRDDSGMTMHEKLDALIETAGWAEAGRAVRIEMVRESMVGYTALARTALLREDAEFASKAVHAEILAQYVKSDRNADEAHVEAERVLKALGLPSVE